MKINKFYKYTIGIILILIIIFLLKSMPFLSEALDMLIRLIFVPIIIGGFFYYILRPFVRFFQSKNINRSFSILIVFSLIIVGLVLITVYGGVSIKQEFSKFFTDILNKFEIIKKDASGIFKGKFDSIMSMQNIEEQALGFLESGLRGAKKGTISIINKISNFGSIIILTPFVIFYLLKDGESFVKIFLKLIPLKYREETEKVLIDADEILSTYISGRLIVAVVLGILTFIGYLIIKLPNAFVLSIITMIFSIIPMVGPIISLIPALIFAITADIYMVIKVLVVVSVVQQIEGNFITPKVIGDNLKIHPLTIIFLVIVSISLLGFIGALIAIPLYAVIKVIIKDVYEFKRMKELKE